MLAAGQHNFLKLARLQMGMETGKIDVVAQTTHVIVVRRLRFSFYVLLNVPIHMGKRRAHLTESFLGEQRRLVQVKGEERNACLLVGPDEQQRAIWRNGKRCHNISAAAVQLRQRPEFLGVAVVLHHQCAISLTRQAE